MPWLNGVEQQFNLFFAKRPANQSVLPMTDTGNQLILVIDDDKDIVQTIKGNLELDGYRVICAYNGRDGLDLIQEQSCLLILIDLR